MTSTCYWLERGTYTKSEAEDLCHRHGGHLAYVKEESTLSFLSANVALAGNFTLIALSKNVLDNTWTWADGTEMTFHHAWYPGYPQPDRTYQYKLRFLIERSTPMLSP